MKKCIFILFSTLAFAQQYKNIDFKSVHAKIYFNVPQKEISVTANYNFVVNNVIDTIRIDAVKMNFTKVIINGKPVNYKNNSKEILLFEGYKNGKNSLSVSYTAQPTQTLYFIDEGGLQIWTQGQGKYTSHWLPSFNDVNEKMIFNYSITFDNEYTVLSNGVLRNKKFEANKNKTVWDYEMCKPMPSYLAVLAIGKFAKNETISQNGIPLEFYLDKNDTDKFKTTYAYSKQIFDFLNKKIGIKYPWKVYRQVPVRDFLYGGMENTTTTIFTQDWVVDSISKNDKNYVEIDAHELAHHWFGDLITAKSSKDHWLQEGFATYYSMLAEREIYGEDYFYNLLYRNATLIKDAAKKDTIPVLNEKASSLSYYQKGAWALFYIKENIGEKTFDKIIKKYIKKYQYQNVTTDDFLAMVKQYSDFDIEDFKKRWLEDYSYPEKDIDALLSKNQTVTTLIKLQKENKQPFDSRYDELLNLMISPVFHAIKIRILNQIKNIPFDKKVAIIRAAMETQHVKVRQTVAQTVEKIPADFKTEYETLLQDASYNTREAALANLWINFPDSRKNYYELSKNWQGKNDKSLRIMFLFLTQTADFLSDDEKKNYHDELIDFTTEKYESSIRQNAFEVLLSETVIDKMVLKNLVNFTTCFRWQFSGYAKDSLKDLVKDETVKQMLTDFLPELNAKEKFQAERILNATN